MGYRPDLTVMVDWALKANFHIYLFLHGVHPDLTVMVAFALEAGFYNLHGVSTWSYRHGHRALNSSLHSLQGVEPRLPQKSYLVWVPINVSFSLFSSFIFARWRFIPIETVARKIMDNGRSYTCSRHVIVIIYVVFVKFKYASKQLDIHVHP